MILATDVHYHADYALAAGVLFATWEACTAVQELAVRVAAVADYEPGHFYKRELPCLLALLHHLEALPQVIIVDGYVHLGSEQRPGLGWHLYQALDGRVPIVGIAKSRFHDTPPGAAVVRGRSQNPLFVTAMGMSEAVAKQNVRLMCGPYRTPTLLKRVDGLSREG